MENKIFILVHGPFADNAYPMIFKSLIKVHVDGIIISSYLIDKERTEKAIDDYRDKFGITLSYSKDLINPGYFNLNRQVTLVSEGMKLIPNDAIVVKLRNDQWCDLKRVIRLINRFYKNPDEKRIISTNCYTRKDRYYHPSDMFLCGRKEQLEMYYSYPLQRESHENYQLRMRKMINEGHKDFSRLVISPESELFAHYLRINGWDLLFSNEDSKNAIDKYMYIINTWDISLRWTKRRNAFLPANTIILPYSFELEPFRGAEIEDAKCLSRSDFNGHITLKDCYYLILSKMIFGIQYGRGFKRILFIFQQLTPTIIKNQLKKTRTGGKLSHYING